MPHALLWAGKANTCPGKESISDLMGSVTFSWQSGVDGAVQLSDMQRGISRALPLRAVFYSHCHGAVRFLN